MRADGYFKNTHTFEYWEPIFTPNPDGTLNMEFRFVENRTGRVASRPGGNYYLFTKEQMPLDGEVRKLRGRDGDNLLTVDGVEYYLFVQSAEPEFDMFSNVIGWNHVLVKAASTV